MRILNISSLYPPNVVGGAEMGLQTMSEAMVDLGHELHVLTLQPPRGEGKPVGDSAGTVNVQGVPLANIYWPFGARKTRSSALRAAWHGIDTANAVMAGRIKKLALKIRPDVVLTRNLQGISTAVIPALAKAGLPVVHVLHDYGLLCPQTTLSRNGRECGLKKERCSPCRILTAPRWQHAKHLSGVIGVSQAVLDLHLTHGLFTNIPNRAIYNALSPRFSIVDQPRARGDEIMRFGYLGRVEQSKGIETLLQACVRLNQQGIKFELQIAGRGDRQYLATLQQKYPLSQVSYQGFVDAPDFLRQIDTLVFPSLWHEALGNGVFEAFSQGCPVIGSDRGGIPESIDHGDNGWVFTAGDSADLARRMHLLTVQPQRHREMAFNAIGKSRQYQAHLRATQYLDFLQQVTQRQRRAS